jgi:steroid 5-alpha reductase family enzyme
MTLAKQNNHSSAKNIFNALLLLMSAVPVLLQYSYFLSYCENNRINNNPGNSFLTGYDQNVNFTQNLCKFGVSYPAYFLHILLVINLDLWLWILSLLQNSTWLIDPYWTMIPLFLAHYYQFHPAAVGVQSQRFYTMLILLYIWSVRLTHSYFRREEYNFGLREDWRFTQMQKDYIPKVGKLAWKVGSLFIVYVSQHLFLYGVTLPLYAVSHTANQPPFGPLDYAATGLSVAGLLIAYFADTSLRAFMIQNEQLREAKQPTIPILDQGVWGYSRHPNYLGEILWWSGFSLFAVIAGHSSYIWGNLLNALCLVIVSYMVERRMEEKKERLDAFRDYQARVAMLLPNLSTVHLKSS